MISPKDRNNKKLTEEEVRKIEEMLPQVQHFQQDNPYFECRILGNLRYSGIFPPTKEGLISLAEAMKKREMDILKTTVYFTFNLISPNVIEKKNIGKLFKGGEKGFRATKDGDIERVKRIHLDIDPVRAEGFKKHQATEAECERAKETTEAIVDFLRTMGIDKPTISFSGNGYNIDFAVNVENTPENVRIIQMFTQLLAHKFNNDYADVDISVYNPSRITKMYGTLSCKGENTAERPYRYSKIIKYGSNEPVNFELIQNFVAEFGGVLSKGKPKRKKTDTPKKPNDSAQVITSPDFSVTDTSKKYLPIVDVERYLDSYEIGYKIIDKGVYILYQLDVCPFDDEHDRGECALIAVEGKGVCFHCFHNSCQERTIFDFVQKYPCGSIPPVDSDGKIENVFNYLVCNGKLLKNRKGVFFFFLDGEVYPLCSKMFRTEIQKISLKLNRSIPAKNFDSRIVEMIEAFSNDEEFYTEAEVEERIILNKNTLFYALWKGKYVKVDGKGCSIVDNVPDGLFFVKTDLKPQVVPDLKASPEELPALLLKVFNVDNEQLPLIITNLLSFFRNDINSPILVLKGTRGSGKSSCARIIKSIVHPEIVDLINFPDKEDGLTASLSNNYICVFDNVERIAESMSAKLCMSVTNGFTSKRKLFTDNDEISICISCNVILTCITDVVSKGDLAERSNIINFEKAEIYRTEAEMNAEVERLMPQILGSIFNTLSKIFASNEKITIDKPPRMADYAFFAVSVMRALGLDENDFLNIYTQNLTEAISVCAVGHPLIKCINRVLSDKGGNIEMSATELLDLLNLTAERLGIKLDVYNPATLSRELGKISGDLHSIGIDSDKGRAGSKRVIKLSRSYPTNIASKYEDDSPLFPDIDFSNLDLDDD